MAGLDAKDTQELISIITAAVNSAIERQSGEQIRELTEVLHEMKTEQALISSRLAPIEEMLKKHDEKLLGNGHIGLLERMNRVEPLVKEDHEALFGCQDNPSSGLISRVDKNDHEHSLFKKPITVILTSMLSSGGALLLAYLIGLVK